MHTRTATLALLILAPVSGAIGSDSRYETARSQGIEDSTNPLYQDWYLGEMRPVFSSVFQTGLDRCTSSARGNELTTLGLVFVVDSDGAVGEFFASDDTRFARCLEATIRGQGYPPAPKEQFYFGLDFAPPSKGTRAAR